MLAAVQPTSTVASTALVLGAKTITEMGYRTSDDQGLSTVTVVSLVDKSSPETETAMENNRAGLIAQGLIRG